MTLVERYGLPPEEIERRSFEIIRGLVPDLSGTPEEQQVRVRMVHAAGDPTIARDVHIHPRAVEAGVEALRSGAPIVTDVRMIAVGVSPGHCERLGVRVECMLDHPDVAARARAEGTTRAIAAVRLWGPRLDGAVVAIGNAPTALLALLDLVDAGVCRPALVVGTPVGFVNAAESKEELRRRDAVPSITVAGWRGGSTLAVAALNALLRLATGIHGYLG
ncbi:precorrin-8X methylmutase [Caldinitratiruptor microaerophilus]|uniref:Precorrin isomerase n=1 Tax=Caldinitratiruptor microaerophilus TaxID=671077 RepID=A0AA35CLT2_9FIRM|nr:precorrin-8X methylmutase [Caldinitratiruptor microaerophilus]BDG61562.1 precorrin isomerase [Caldinitratiruptor microaerophilus]